MKKIIYILLLSLVISQDEQLSDYHISLSLHENLINDFFSNMGDIEGRGETAIGSYNWKLVEPRIDIEEDTILFFSKVRLSVGDLKTYKEVKGWVSATYNQEINKVILQIEEAEVILDIDIFGKNFIITELDISEYFDKPFKLSGPQPMSDNIEFNLPDGSKREIFIGTNQSYMVLTKDAILVKTSLVFNQSNN
tara:strand:+ start:982 stop:1563 length:582 start_codon:yes stop_codon:yes gene_type:complete